jgi:hypothetical protein
MAVLFVVIDQREANLLQIIGALSASRRIANPLHGRQQHREKHRNDGNNHEQLYKREAATRRNGK